MGIEGTRLVPINTNNSHIHSFDTENKNISSIGLAILDFNAHSGYPTSSYNHESANLNTEQKHYEIEMSFNFDGVSVIYTYIKEYVDRTIYEKVVVDGVTVAELDHRVSGVAFIDLKGAENLHRDLTDRIMLCLLRYINNNTILDDNKCNNAVIKLFNYSYDLRHCGFSYIDSSLKNENSPHMAKAVRFIEHNSLVEKLNIFMTEFGLEGQLYIDDSWGTKHLRVKGKAGETRMASVILNERELSLVYIFFNLHYPSSALILDDMDKIIKPSEEEAFMRALSESNHRNIILTSKGLSL